MTAPKNNRKTVKEAVEEENLSAFEHFATLGTGIQVAISRHPGKYLEILPLEGLDEEVMRERYGGGKFQLRAREDGAFKKGAKTRYIEIEGAPKQFPPPAVDPNATEVERLKAKLEALTGQSSGPSSSDNMVAIATLLAPVLTAIVTAAMDRPPPPDPIDTLNLFRKMLKDDREGRPVPGDSGLDPIVEKLGLPLLGEIQKLRAIDQGASNGSSPPQIPAATGKPPETLPELAAFVARWAAPHCQRGTNPQLRAELFLEELTLQEPRLVPSVIELSRVPDVLEHWIKLVPEVALNREWHGSFIREIRELADLADSQPPDSSQPGPEGADSDAGHPERGQRHAGDPGSDGAAIPAGVAE